MLKLFLVSVLIVAVPPLLGQSPPNTSDPEESIDIEQLLDEHIDTYAELESWMLAESTLADIARAINVADIVTPQEDFLKITFQSLAKTFAGFSDSELGVNLELTPDNLVKVTSIEPGGRFHHSDLKANDVIKEINEKLAVDRIDDPVQTVQYYLLPYARVIKGFPPLVLNVTRGGNSVDVEISNDDETLKSFGYKSGNLSAPTLNLVKNRHGTFALHYELPPSVFLIEIEEQMGQYFDVEFGVLVLQAPKDHGFKAGDILVEIEETSIRSIDHVTKALTRSDNDVINIVVKRKGKSVELETDRSSVIFRNAEEQMTH